MQPVVFISRIDDLVLVLFNRLGAIPGVAPISSLISAVGNIYIWLAIAFFLLVTRRQRALRLFVVGFAAVAATVLLTDLIKHLVAKPRPYEVLPYIVRYGNVELSRSFPSGHASQAFAAAAVLSAGVKKWRLVWFAIAIAIAASRMILGVHYPSDVIAAALLGFVIGWGFVKGFRVKDVDGPESARWLS
ncbi:MAG: phosphatase PAP2 family protein [Chloroflexi bacterium]|nr:phosphatase PAP2 family protein [Chloroflexota bacterium]